jgi:hypothetical protein
LRVDLPTAFGGLQTGAAAADIPMLGQRKDLIGADRWIPDVEEASAAEIVRGLVGVGPTVGGGDPPPPALGGAAPPVGLFWKYSRKLRNLARFSGVLRRTGIVPSGAYMLFPNWSVRFGRSCTIALAGEGGAPDVSELVGASGAVATV